MNILQMIDQWLEKIFFKKFKWLRNFLSILCIMSMFGSPIAIDLKYIFPLLGVHKIFGYNLHASWLGILLYSSIGTFVVLVLLLQWYETKSIKKYGKELTFSHYVEVVIARRIVKRFPSWAPRQKESKQK